MTIHVPAERSTTGAFKIRTQSPARFVVINTRGRYVVKRTRNFQTAETERRRIAPAGVIFDQREGVFV